MPSHILGAAALILILFAPSVGAQTDTKYLVRADSLRQVLEQMFDADQRYRSQVDSIRDRYGPDSKQVQLLWQKQSRVDSLNLVKLRKITEMHGWPKQSEVGGRAVTAAFLVLQHGDLEMQKRYLPLLKQAAQAGEARKQHLALLIDRIRVKEGRKQLYGTQLRRSPETNELELHPVENPQSVDERRAEMGLSPLEEYLEQFDLRDRDASENPERP